MEASDLTIGTFNLAYMVMHNVVANSEGPMVQQCQQEYAGGWDAMYNISKCTMNAARLISSFDIFGLQEVHWEHATSLMEAIRRSKPDATFEFVYHERGGQIIGCRSDKLGKPKSVYMGPFPLGPSVESPSWNPADVRGIQCVYIRELDSMFFNVHVPHRLNIKVELEKTYQEMQKKIKSKDMSRVRVFVIGDFNDDSGRLKGETINLFKHEMRIPKDLLIKTCCTDSGYRFPGDYILCSENVDIRYYGFPKGYVRGKPLMSDHDPLVLTIGKERSGPMRYNAVVIRSGSYVELRLLDADEDHFLSLALQHAHDQKLKWKVRKPHAWTDYGSAPHVTLDSTMAKLVGKMFEVKVFDKPYHFSTKTSHWIALPVELSEGLTCAYECHMSIGQQRI